MKLAINAIFQAHGGSLTNLLQLLERWSATGASRDHQVVVYAGASTAAELKGKIGEEIEVHTLRAADRGLLRRTVLEQFLIPLRLKRDRADVLFCPANTMPFFSPVPVVTTFQNAAPYCESVARAGFGFGPWLRFTVLRQFIRMSAMRSTRVVFISNFFRDLLVERYGVDLTKAAMIYRANTFERHPPSGEDRDVARRLGIDRPFLFTAAHLYAFKNLVELVEAHGRLKAAGRSEMLVIAGEEYLSGYRDRILAKVREIGLEDDVLLPGRLPSREVGALLRCASVYVFSSTCENCPTALVEALASGVPVACSNVGVMPEIAGDGAEYFDPYNPVDMARAIERLLTDERRRSEVVERALVQSAKFPDKATVADRTLEVILDAAATRRRAAQ